MDITESDFNKLLDFSNITVIGFRTHSKASEKYVDVKIIHDNFSWIGSIPYFYRRTGIFIETPKELAVYLKDIYQYFSKERIDSFVEKEKKRWEVELSKKKTTKDFFDKLLNLEWNSVQYNLPINRNWARRVQDIKELGYTLATFTFMQIKDKNEKDTHIMLIPIPKGGVTNYEVMSKVFKKKAIKELNKINIYELSTANQLGLIPDHKFPEIRWDTVTNAENADDMAVKDIKSKFQLLDNQRNLQKREVCRKCFQTNKRGTIFGINYYYQGNEDWPNEVPKVGKNAEKGCVGCAWYDIEVWRNRLNNFLKDSYNI